MSKIDRAEWRKGYPIKKLVLMLSWTFLFFGTLIIIRSIILEERNVEKMIGLAIFGGTTIFSFCPIKKYILTKYHCIPYLGNLLSKEELNGLLEGEEFQRVEALRETELYSMLQESDQWFLLNGGFISKKLALFIYFMTDDDRTKRPRSYAEIVWLNGETTRWYIGGLVEGHQKIRFAKYLKKHTDIVPSSHAFKNEKAKKNFAKISNEGEWGNMTLLEKMKHSDEIKKKSKEMIPQRVWKCIDEIDETRDDYWR